MASGRCLGFLPSSIRLSTSVWSELGGAVALSSAHLTVPQIMATGLAVAAILLVLGATGLMSCIYRLLPLPVVRGVQLPAPLATGDQAPTRAGRLVMLLAPRDLNDDAGENDALAAPKNAAASMSMTIARSTVRSQAEDTKGKKKTWRWELRPA